VLLRGKHNWLALGVKMLEIGIMHRTKNLYTGWNFTLILVFCLNVNEHLCVVRGDTIQTVKYFVL